MLHQSRGPLSIVLRYKINFVRRPDDKQRKLWYNVDKREGRQKMQTKTFQPSSKYLSKLRALVFVSANRAKSVEKVKGGNRIALC